MKVYFIFIDAAYEMDFRQELDKIVNEYFIIPKVLYKGEIPQFDDIVWPGYRVGIILQTNNDNDLTKLLNKWKDKVKFLIVR
jgi:hypothetical protein